MEKRFIELTSGWIPVVVLLLFALALIAGNEQPAAAAGTTGQGAARAAIIPSTAEAMEPGADEIVVAAGERQAALTQSAEQ